MVLTEYLDTTEIEYFTRPLDHPAEMPMFGSAELEQFLSHLREGRYEQAGSFLAINSLASEDFSVSSLVRVITGGSISRLQNLEQRGAFAGPYLGYDQNRQTVQRPGITIYVREQESADDGSAD